MSEKADFRRSICALPPVQKTALMSALVRRLNLDLETCQVRPRECPLCHSVRASFVRRGVSYGAQRYHCSDCGRRFTFHPAEILRGSHVSVKVWTHQVEDYFEGYTIEASAERDDISTRTVSRLRALIRENLQPLLREGVLEASLPAAS